MVKSIIKTVNLSKSYFLEEKELTILKNINLVINKGELVAIIGPSGSGKSTLMHILGCLDTPTKGQVFLDDKDLSNLSENQLAAIRNHQIGFVFQMFNLLPKTSALDNVMLPIAYSQLSLKEGRRKAIELLEKVGLENRMHHFPNQLSGGEQQRVAIARCLINNPSVILADEPTGNLDSRNGQEIISLLKDINKDGNTVIIVTHDISIAHKCKRIIHIKDGQII